jgi:molecular chaperone IbpA
MTQYRLSTFDLPTLRRHTIGFDRLFNELSRTFENSKTVDNYPPHNVLQTGDNTYTVELAVTGFREDELSVQMKDKLLRVEGTHDLATEEAATVEYIHRGLAQRNFIKEWTLPEHMEVKSVRVRNGIMFIMLEQLIPEEQKPKSIAITFD